MHGGVSALCRLKERTTTNKLSLSLAILVALSLARTSAAQWAQSFHLIPVVAKTAGQAVPGQIFFVAYLSKVDQATGDAEFHYSQADWSDYILECGQQPGICA